MQSNKLNPRLGRFLHLVPDEKFIDAARGIFEEASPGDHDFLFIGQQPLRLIRTFNPICIEIDAVLDRGFLSALPRYSAVFVHYLNDVARCVIALSPKDTRFVWLGWGNDFYHLIQPRSALILPKTRTLLAKQATLGAMVHKARKRLMRWSRFLASPSRIATLVLLNRTLARVGESKPEELVMINRFLAISTPIRDDFDAMRTHHPGLRAPFLDWNYWTEGFETGGALSSQGSKKRHVLLGNSATPENNHVEALDLLSTCLPDDWYIYCPLSYGDKAYGDAIEEYGNVLFGDRFIALREYMPIETYSEIVSGCLIIVMNHVRQQALGNIILSLYAGSFVFLNEMSPIHAAMQRIGVDIETIDRLPLKFKKSVMESLDDRTTNQVRQRIEASFGRASILQRTRKILHDLDLTIDGSEAADHV